MYRNIAAIFLLLQLGLIAPAYVSAEFYKYYDENGVEVWTDDLAKVPENQRPDVNRYKEADDALTPAEKHKKRQREIKADTKAGRFKTKKPDLDKTVDHILDMFFNRIGEHVFG